MLHICCIRAGEAFSPAYVDILFDMVRRNLAEGFEGEFVCFTDQPDTLAEGIVVRPLPADLPGWWSKLALFRDGLFPDGDRVLFFDLDTVITGRLDELAAYDGPFAILRDFYRQDGLQSAVMAWRAGTALYIWDSYSANGCPQDFPGGDQGWIEHVSALLIVERLQDIFPDLFASYKAGHLERNPPDKASVVVFHGEPRPHQVLTGWVPEVWKIGGLMRSDLDIICNIAREQLERNVVSACTRNLAWFDTAPAHLRQVAIVGGGPSLQDSLPELRMRAAAGQEIWAINGAGRFLVAHNIVPDLIVIADARPENVTFILPRVFALLASQCDPAVFDAADNAVLWHVNSPGMEQLLAGETERPVHLIGGGSTAGLEAMVLAYSSGYRAIHLYGFDSSYDIDRHHAYSQSLNDADRVVDVLFDGQKFKAAGWMVQQANEFQELAVQLATEGCIITVAGTGLLPAIAHALARDPIERPADKRAREVLKRLNGAAKPRGAEIGVFSGEMSAALLRSNERLHLDMIDSWEGLGAAYAADTDDWHATLTQERQDAYAATAASLTAFASDRRTILRQRSVEAAANPYIYDFVFLDADHSYEGLSADIAAWFPKVKPHGWIGGHDYSNPGFPLFGVNRAVDEFVEASGLKLELGDNYTWFVQVPAIPQTEQNP